MGDRFHIGVHAKSFCHRDAVIGKLHQLFSVIGKLHHLLFMIFIDNKVLEESMFKV